MKDSIHLLKIIFLEDVPEDVELVKRVLHKSGIQADIRNTDTRDGFLSILNDFYPDIILSDHSMPQFNSLDALHLSRSVGIVVPFILVTGTVSEEFAVKCLQEGADDYILKTNLTRLPSAILNAQAKRREEESRKRAEEALLFQNEELTKVNQELDRFVYSISHNIRAPLMSVLGLLNLAKADLKNGSQEEFERYFSMMEGSVDRLDHTLKEIIDYSRNSRTDVRMEPVNVQELIDETFQNFSYLPGADKIHREIEVDGPSTVLSDQLRLSVILNNIISNAIKYRDVEKDTQKISIHIKTENHLYFTVEDNGIGIRPEYLDLIFDMFFRATERSDGSGLGLYIVREAVEKMEGTIGVTSAFGQGTTFSVSIPVWEAEPQLVDRPRNKLRS